MERRSRASGDTLRHNQLYWLLLVFLAFASGALLAWERTSSRDRAPAKSCPHLNGSSSSSGGCSGEGRHDQCYWASDCYLPSEWETYWTTHIEEFKFEVCSTMRRHEESQKAQKLVRRVQELMAPAPPPATFSYQPTTDDLLSRHRYRLVCAGGDGWAEEGSEMETLIEPLIGNTRDPFTMCPVDLQVDPAMYAMAEPVQSKRHLLFGPSTPVRVRGSSTHEWSNWVAHSDPSLQHIPPPLQAAKQRRHQIVLFDLGAALYQGFVGGEFSGGMGSTAFFVEAFTTHRGYSFDRIFAYEFVPQNASVVWDAIPEELMSVYTYINVGVQPKGKYHPWGQLRKFSKEDYVVVKLDIDTPMIENELMAQLLADESLTGLIDEMTYEHHTNLPDMDGYWEAGSLYTLADTYRNFIELRRRGIRMHSWP